MLQSVLSDDQLFLLRKAYYDQAVDDKVNSSEVDPSLYTCVHFCLSGNGFGSEVNNLLSAAVFCEQNGLHCVVDDRLWNSGRLHDYLEAEPLICRRCPCEAQCRPLEVKRDQGMATNGWFVICKHGRRVSFETKADLTQRLWKYTKDTEQVIEALNRELDLPSFYVAVHIRRGDKTDGAYKETLEVPIANYVRAALEQLQPPCTAIAVCTDDVAAAKEFAAEVNRVRPEVRLRWRAGGAKPEQLRLGHRQHEFNALPLEGRMAMTHLFIADIEVMRKSHALVCTYSSNVGRLVALLRDRPTISLDSEWTND